MQQFGLNTTEIKILSDIFESIDGLDTVWIYGSRANGTATPVSDIDLCIRVKPKNHAQLVMSELREKLYDSNLIYVVDLTDIDGISNPTFLSEIEKHKVLMYKKKLN
jgi:uncharacterized protein